MTARRDQASLTPASAGALPEDGGIAALLSSLDASDCPLGPVVCWPAALQSLVGVIVPAAASMVAFWGDDLIAVYNDAYAPSIGTKHPGALGQPARHHWAESWDDLEPMLRRVLDTGETITAKDRPFVLERGSGREDVFFDIAYSPVREPDGRVGGVLCIVTETTDRVRAEARLRANEAALLAREAELARVQRIGEVGGFDVDLADGFRTRRSPGYLRIHGLPPEAAGESLEAWVSRIHPDDRKRVTDEFHAAVAGDARDYAAEYRIVRPSDGEMRWIAARAEIERDAGGQPLLLVGAHLDVTDRKLSEQALRDAEHLNRRILEGSHDCITLLDLDARLLFVNRGGLLSMDVEDSASLIGRSWLEAWPPDGRVLAAQAVVEARAGGTGRFQALCPTRAGHPRWWDVSVVPVLDEAGRPERIATFSRDMTEEHEAEATMRRSEAELRLVTDALPVLISFIDRDLVYRFNNRAYGDWLGVPLDQVVGRRVADIVGRDLFRARREQVEAALAGRAVTFDAMMPAKGGVLRECEIRYLPRRDSTGEVDGFYVLVIDMSERKRAESAARESELRFRRIADSTPEPMWVADLEGRREFVNAAYSTFLGRSYDEALVNEWQTLIHPDDRGRVAREREAGERSRQGFELEGRFRRADGEMRWLRIVVQPRLGQDGVHAGWIGVSHDVTLAKRAEIELRRLNETLEHRVSDALAERRLWAEVFETTDAMIAILDRDYRFLALNGAYAREFERIHRRRPAVGDDLLLILRNSEYDFVEPNWSRALSGQEFTTVDEFGSDPAHRRYYELKFSTLRDAAGGVAGAFLYAIEVTDRLHDLARLAEAEEQLRQAQKMEAIGQLTGGIAHDFNNLLTGIVGSLDLMRTRMQQGRTESLERYIGAALASAHRAAALTHRLLAFSRRQPLDPRPVHANALVASMDDLVRRTLGEAIRLEIVLGEGVWATLCDSNQLENAVLNLVINARDAMPDGGTLTIETSNAELDAAFIGAEPDAGPTAFVCLSVSDTGCGMTPDVIARAFDPFFTTKPIGQGTGLGLSMIYGFARQSEGHARIDSEPGLGTTVRLYLPRHMGDEPVARSPEVASDAAPRGERGSVLVVEDETVVRQLVVEILSDLGHRALEAADGAAGLALLQSNAAVDLLVTDMGLPGLNGRQLADAARVARPGLKVLFITGYAETAALAAGFLEPGMEMITKPFAVDALARKIEAMIAVPADPVTLVEAESAA